MKTIMQINYCYLLQYYLIIICQSVRKCCNFLCNSVVLQLGMFKNINPSSCFGLSQEVVAWRYSVKKVFIKILQNLQEKTGASF